MSAVIVIFYFLSGVKIINSDHGNLLLDTPGCTIPDYNMTYYGDHDPKISCGTREVFIKKLPKNYIQFSIKNKQFQQIVQKCCYRYIMRSDLKRLEDKHWKYSTCKPFKDGTKAILRSEFINVKCNASGKLYYDDAYAVVKKLERKSQLRSSREYNVLLIGLSSMSRTRAYHSLNSTLEYMRDTDWSDFRAYNKIAIDSLQNILALLTGKFSFLPMDDACMDDMSACNGEMIWHEFQKRGYVTAYGEDGIFRKGMFQDYNGFSVPPTHHYMTPLFLSSESKKGPAICTKRISSGKQILNYILDFVDTYKENKFFGFFWVSSFSQDPDVTPKAFDTLLLEFFKKLNAMIEGNTFVIFFSDQGISNGPARFQIQSFYDERLPMLFIYTPRSFGDSQGYYNMFANQYRLVSPFDVYLTIWDILKISTDDPFLPKAEDCPLCTSLFDHVPEHRDCFHSGVSEEICGCNTLTPHPTEEFSSLYCLVKATMHMDNVTASIATKTCTSCKPWSFRKVHRVHKFALPGGLEFYVIAFTLDPEKQSFEMILLKSHDKKYNNFTYEVLSSQLISTYTGTGFCAFDKREKTACVCEVDDDCDPKNVFTSAEVQSLIH